MVVLKGMQPFCTMEKRHIEMFKNQMVNCALYLKKAGWDGVEIMAGVGGILNRFMSPATNNRTDEYGGNMKNRMRLTVETIQAVRAAVGEDFLITCRWSPVEYVTGVKPGNTIDDAVLMVHYLEEAGIDLHNLSVGWHETSIPLTTKDVPDGYWTWISERIKTVAEKPVAMGYRNTDPLIMERISAPERRMWWQAYATTLPTLIFPRRSWKTGSKILAAASAAAAVLTMSSAAGVLLPTAA